MACDKCTSVAADQEAERRATIEAQDESGAIDQTLYAIRHIEIYWEVYMNVKQQPCEHDPHPPSEDHIASCASCSRRFEAQEDVKTSVPPTSDEEDDSDLLGKLGD